MPEAPIVKIPCKAIIFDMDGTMIDNMMIHHKAWQKHLAELGLELSLEEVRISIHGVNSEIIKRLFPGKYSEEEIRKLAWDKEQAYRDIYFDQVKLIDGLKEFLETLKSLGVPMGIGTAAPRVNVEFILDRLGLNSFFPIVYTSDDVEKGKPNPEVFQKVAADLGIPLSECLVFEDSPTGALASANGGASSIIITTTHSSEEFSKIKNTKGFINDYRKISAQKHSEQKDFLISLS